MIKAAVYLIIFLGNDEDFSHSSLFTVTPVRPEEQLRGLQS